MLLFGKIVIETSDKRIAQEAHLLVGYRKIGGHYIGVVPERTNPCASRHTMLLISAGIDRFAGLDHSDAAENADVGYVWPVRCLCQPLPHNGLYLQNAFLPWRFEQQFYGGCRDGAGERIPHERRAMHHHSGLG